MEAGAIESLSATTIKVIYRVNGVWHMEKTGRVREKNTSRPPAAATRRDPPGAPGEGGGVDSSMRWSVEGAWRVIKELIGRVIGG